MADGILWALSRAIVERLGRLDHASNNLGWRMGSTAAMTNGFAVAMDLTLDVTHPKGSGYDQSKAQEEMAVFLSQLSPAQRAYIDMVEMMAQLRREQQDLPRCLKREFWRRKLHWRRVTECCGPGGSKAT